MVKLRSVSKEQKEKKPRHFCTETISDSMLTAADAGRAQFVGISIETFAIRSATSVENEENKKTDEMFE